MNEFGEPNMGKPSVRFDAGREGAGHWRQRLSTQPLLPILPNPLNSALGKTNARPRFG